MIQQLPIPYLQEVCVLIIITYAILEVISIVSKLFYAFLVKKIKGKKK